MDDETNALLYMAGPANWHHAIAPTRINMGNNTIITHIPTTTSKTPSTPSESA